MIKVGIITISKVDNYGAELQSFAFQYKLNKMGYDAENIDYLFYKNKRHKREAISRPFYSFPLKNRLKEVCLPKIEAFKSFFYRRAALRRKKGFEAFHQKYNKYSSKVYTSYSELYENVPEYDVYCVGSDQVWSPSCYTSLHPYFLTFAPRYKKKISYQTDKERKANSISKKRTPQGGNGYEKNRNTNKRRRRTWNERHHKSAN